MIKRIVACLLCISMVACSLAGCSNNSSNQQDNNSPNNQTQASSDNNSASSVKVGWYAPLVHDYFEKIKEGVEAYDNDSDTVSIEYTYGSADTQTQECETSKVEGLAAKGIQYFMCYPMESEGANNLYSELTSAGCKVINYAQPGTTPTTASFYIGTDTASRTIYQADEVLKLNGGSAKVLVIYEALESPYMQKAKATMDEYVKDHPEFEIVQECSGMSDTETAVSKITDAVAANADKIDAIVCIGYTCCVGLSRVLTDYYKTNPNAKHMIVVCNDIDEEIATAIKAGYIDKGMFEPLYAIGYIATQAIDLLAQGKEPKDDTYVISLDDIIVTKENADTYANGVKDYTQSVSDSLLEKYFK